jgi:hypothetical protein
MTAQAIMTFKIAAGLPSISQPRKRIPFKQQLAAFTNLQGRTGPTFLDIAPVGAVQIPGVLSKT